MDVLVLIDKLDDLIQQFQQAPEKAPPLDALRDAALSLQEKDPAHARRLLEYVYTRQIAERNFAPANFLGLAEVRLTSTPFLLAWKPSSTSR